MPPQTAAATVREMPETIRDVFLLRRVLDLSTPEIAVRLGKSEREIEAALSDAMRACASVMAASDDHERA